MTVNVSVDGLEQIQKALNKLRLPPNEIESVLEEAVLLPLFNSAERAFETQTSPFGEAWQPLHHKTINKKKHDKILIHTGTLKNSLYKQVQDLTGFVGVNASFKDFQYGLSHQFGSLATTKRAWDIPERPFLPIDLEGNIPSSIEDKIERNLLEWFDD